MQTENDTIESTEDLATTATTGDAEPEAPESIDDGEDDAGDDVDGGESDESGDDEAE